MGQWLLFFVLYYIFYVILPGDGSRFAFVFPFDLPTPPVHPIVRADLVMQLVLVSVGCDLPIAPLSTDDLEGERIPALFHQSFIGVLLQT